jgi:hypothetical protein
MMEDVKAWRKKNRLSCRKAAGVMEAWARGSRASASATA